MSKGKKIGGIVLIVIGTILLVIGIAIGALFGAMNGAMDDAIGELEDQIEEFKADAVLTYGEIIAIDDDGTADVEYCDEEGYWYDTYIVILTEDYRVGDYVEVYYEPDDPGSVMVPELLMSGMGMMGDTMPVVGIIIGCIFGGIGLLLLIIGIVLIVTNKKDQKWTDEIKARNAAHGIGTAPYNGYQQMPNGYQQPGGMPGGAPNGYQQPGGAPNGYQQPGGMPNSYGQQPGGQGGSNPYQQNM